MRVHKGFTLIELLVVVAIIALLSSLAIISVSGARNKANDAKIKADLDSIRTEIEVTYNGDLSNSSDLTALQAKYVSPSCAANLTVGRYMITGAATAGAAWAAYSDLCAETGYYCIDSTGVSKKGAGALPSPVPTACP